MSTPVTYAGNAYSVPAYGDVGYAQGAGNLSAYLIALATGSLTVSGGNVTLLADANFGPNFGLVSLYFKSVSANIATAGVLRLANTDLIEWRNFANGGNLPLGVNGSDQLVFNGAVISTATTNGTVSAGTLGRLALYPASSNTVDDIYVQNAFGIDVLIATQAARSVALEYTIPNPGNAVATAIFALLGLAQTFTALQTFTSNIAFNPTTAGIVGTTTNDNAASGNVGEQVQSVVGAGSVGTTAQFFDITSISLTAGDWNVSGVAVYARNGATIIDYSLGISTAAGNSASGLVTGDTFIGWTVTAGVATQGQLSLTLPDVRISIGSTTTIYLKGYSEYSVATPTRTGRITARRVR